MFCRKCGYEIPDDSAFCVRCGAPVEHAIDLTPEIDALEEATRPVTVIASNPKKKSIGMLLVLAIFAVLLVIGGIFFFVNRRPNDSAGSILDNKNHLNEITASVLKIECYDVLGELYATGSGFVAFDDDTVVTNYHVIEDHPHAIKALSEDGRSFSITEIVVYHPEMDIAILRAETSTGLSPLSFSEKTAEKADRVVAIGSPLGLMNTVSDGIVSGFTQNGDVGIIQFTASISHGSSGGVLLNEDGEVVGVTFATFSEGQNLNLAIPIDYVEALYNQSSPSNAVSVNDFFNAVEHIYSLSYILQNSNAFMGKTVTIQAYISSSWVFNGNDPMIGNTASFSNADKVLTFEQWKKRKEQKGGFIPKYRTHILVDNESDVLGFSANDAYQWYNLEKCPSEYLTAMNMELELLENKSAMELWLDYEKQNNCVPGTYLTITGTLTTLKDRFPSYSPGSCGLLESGLTLNRVEITY